MGDDKPFVVVERDDEVGEGVVLQPGSTVATALVEGEARPKHVGLLSICGDQWHMEALPLRNFSQAGVALFHSL